MTILNNIERFAFGSKTEDDVEKYSSFKFDSYSSRSNIFKYENNELIIFFTGKIYNTGKLLKWLNLIEESAIIGSADLIAMIYTTYGFDYMMNIVDGVFSLIILDQKIEDIESKLYVVNDEFGITSLYSLTFENTCGNNVYGFSTDYDSLLQLSTNINLREDSSRCRITHVEPGCNYKYTASHKVSSMWEFNKNTSRTVKYCQISSLHDKKEVQEQFYMFFQDSVQKRINTINHFDIVCVVDYDSLESIMMAFMIRKFLKTYYCHKLHIVFTNDDENTSYLESELFQDNVHTYRLIKNDCLTRFIKTIMHKKDFTFFSYMSLNMNTSYKCGINNDCLMEIDSSFFNSISLIHKQLTRDSNKYENMEYPFLDSNFIKKYSSIELSCRDELLKYTFERIFKLSKNGVWSLECI
jgi:hypothetical protein